MLLKPNNLLGFSFLNDKKLLAKPIEKLAHAVWVDL